MIVFLLLTLAYSVPLIFSDKYERNKIYYIIGSLIFTPLITGIYLLFIIEKKKKEGFVAKDFSWPINLVIAGSMALLATIAELSTL